MRRLIAAAESLAIDYGGISIVSRATGVSRRAIARGIVELGNPPVPFGGAIRKPGGGRKSTVEQDATLVRDLELLIEPLSRGDPESPLLDSYDNGINVVALAACLNTPPTRTSESLSQKSPTSKILRPPCVSPLETGATPSQ